MKKLLQCFNPPCRKPSNPPADGQVLGPPDDRDWEEMTIVEEDDGSFFLLCLYSNGWGGDTWHLSVEEAKEQAMFWFGIEENAWQDCYEDEE